MKAPPPRLVRRLVLAPMVVVVSVIVLALSPVILAGAFVTDLVRRSRWRNVRLATFALVYLAHELVAIVVLFVLWIASGFGLWMHARWMVSAHYGFVRRWLRSLYAASGVLLGLRIATIEGPEPQPGPVLVFGRHGGIGNSLMYAGALMISYRRHPRIVMLYLLQWDPVVDVLGHRVPSLFIDHDPRRNDGHVSAIGDLATGMQGMDALVLFPEGHDFTPGLRIRAIRHLWKSRRVKQAEMAEELTNVLPPRHRGAQAAILAAPDADVAFVAHTVLEDVGSFSDVWRKLPLQRPIHARYWRVPASEVPRGDDEVIEWLFAWWERIDTWIAERKTELVLETDAGGTR